MKAFKCSIFAAQETFSNILSVKSEPLDVEEFVVEMSVEICKEEPEDEEVTIEDNRSNAAEVRLRNEEESSNPQLPPVLSISNNGLPTSPTNSGDQAIEGKGAPNADSQLLQTLQRIEANQEAHARAIKAIRAKVNHLHKTFNRDTEETSFIYEFPLKSREEWVNINNVITGDPDAPQRKLLVFNS